MITGNTNRSIAGKLEHPVYFGDVNYVNGTDFNYVVRRIIKSD